MAGESQSLLMTSPDARQDDKIGYRSCFGRFVAFFCCREVFAEYDDEWFVTVDKPPQKLEAGTFPVTFDLKVDNTGHSCATDASCDVTDCPACDTQLLEDVSMSRLSQFYADISNAGDPEPDVMSEMIIPTIRVVCATDDECSVIDDWDLIYRAGIGGQLIDDADRDSGLFEPNESLEIVDDCTTDSDSSDEEQWEMDEKDAFREEEAIVDHSRDEDDVECDVQNVDDTTVASLEVSLEEEMVGGFKRKTKRFPKMGSQVRGSLGRPALAVKNQHAKKKEKANKE